MLKLKVVTLLLCGSSWALAICIQDILLSVIKVENIFWVSWPCGLYAWRHQSDIARAAATEQRRVVKRRRLQWPVITKLETRAMTSTVMNATILFVLSATPSVVMGAMSSFMINVITVQTVWMKISARYRQSSCNRAAKSSNETTITMTCNHVTWNSCFYSLTSSSWVSWRVAIAATAIFFIKVSSCKTDAKSNAVSID